MVALQSGVEISEVVKRHLATSPSASILFLTATLPHHFTDKLEDTFDSVVKSWTAMRSGRAAKRQLQTFGFRGYVRSLDLTYSGNSGWHPHIHAILFMDDCQESGARLEQELFTAWNASVVRRGLRPVSRKRFRVEIPRDDFDVCRYVAKISGATTVAAVAWELQTGAKVQTRGSRSWRKGITPHELYVRAAWGQAWARNAVLELEDVMFRRKWLTWSKYGQSLRELEEDEQEEKEPNVPDIFLPVWFYQCLREIPAGFDVLEAVMKTARTDVPCTDYRGRLCTAYSRGSPGGILHAEFEVLFREHRITADGASVPQGQHKETLRIVRKLELALGEWNGHTNGHHSPNNGQHRSSNGLDYANTA